MTNLRIEKLTGQVLSLSLASPLVTGRGTYDAREVLIVTCELTVRDDGRETRITGFGEAAPLPGWSSEDLETCVETLQKINAPLQLEVRDPEVPDLDALLSTLVDTPTLRAAVELSILDALSRHLQLPLRQLLSGPSGEFVNQIAVQTTIGSSDIETTCSAARAAVDAGAKAVKIKVGATSQAEDLTRIKALRESFPEVRLRLDANGAWSAEEALNFINKAAPLQIDLIEQPLPSGGEEALLALARESSIDIAADESCTSISKTRTLIDSGIDALVLKPSTLGGLIPCRELIEYATSRGVRVIISNLMESAVGRRAAAQLAASMPQLDGPHGLATGSWFSTDTAPDNDQIRGGNLHLSDHPGLGFTPRFTAANPQKQNLFRDARPVQNWLEIQSKQSPEKIALVTGYRQLTYAELAAEVTRRAAHLTRRGVKKGDSVALIAANSADWILAAHAIFWAGATLVALHPRSTEDDLANQLATLNPALIISAREYESLDIPTISPGALANAETPSKPLTARPLSEDDVLTILFTSGSTGHPKAVPLTVGNHLASARASAERLGCDDDDRWLCCLPLCHIGGLAIVLRSVIYGTAIELVPRFEPQIIIDRLSDRPVTLASFVPTMLFRLLDHSADAIENQLRAVLVGGGPITADQLRDARRLGLPVLPTYGMTEAASQLTTLSLDTGNEHLHTAGTPLDGVELQLRDADLSPVATGDAGAIWVRGPMLTSGYLNSYNSAFVDGWYNTGDFGRLDHRGRLLIEHRQSDRIVTGGENVDPLEVEQVLRDSTRVTDVAVVGVDDPEWGQLVAALIVTEDESQHLIDSLQSRCRTELAHFKAPRLWAIANEIPRTATGKVRRSVVRTHFKPTL